MFQQLEQTDDQQMAMYMKLTKKEIIKMLIEANKMLTGYAPIPTKYCDCGKQYQSTARAICDGYCKF